MEAELSSWASFLALFPYCVLASASYPAMRTYAVVRPGQGQALLARIRAWIDTHTDQVIAGSLIIGLWLVANSIYLVVTETAGWRRATPPAARAPSAPPHEPYARAGN